MTSPRRGATDPVATDPVATDPVDAIVIGAGVVGLACARALQRSGRETIVLEAMPWIGSAASSRNSEVIHAGIYYPDGSLKAGLCVAGREALLAYCAERGIAHRLLGKLIVAAEQRGVEGLSRLEEQAARNGVALRWLPATALRKQEPALRAVAALHSPGTGIIDSHGFMVALSGDIEVAGGHIVLATPVTAVTPNGRGFEVVTGGEMPACVEAEVVVNAAGLAAHRIAASIPGLPAQAAPRQYFARGRYYSYSGPVPFKQLIYPLPEQGGLGIHLTLDLAGRARFGPDFAWVEEEDYAFDDSARDAFVASIQRYFPGLDPRRLQPDQCGIRARLAGPGDPFADFRIDGPSVHGIPGLVNLLGIESPGLTASLAIADEVLRRL
ncbi:MAG: NAD(P)/FAD-dependent oxidoreductase [Gammaproteobacteria bacterium]|nr:NAD(P)/FAD-dependent oxidoreductase [Gammaproteobacteria bacterium]